MRKTHPLLFCYADLSIFLKNLHDSLEKVCKRPSDHVCSLLPGHKCPGSRSVRDPRLTGPFKGSVGLLTSGRLPSEPVLHPLIKGFLIQYYAACLICLHAGHLSFFCALQAVIPADRARPAIPPAPAQAAPLPPATALLLRPRSAANSFWRSRPSPPAFAGSALSHSEPHPQSTSTPPSSLAIPQATAFLAQNTITKSVPLWWYTVQPFST